MGIPVAPPPNTMPEVTVIIPTYNRCGYLKEAIQSVCSQTHANWECLIVDDGSTDDTPNMVQTYREDPRIRYLRLDHQGSAAASRNHGLKHSRSPYVAFLDDDDSWVPHALERELHILTAHPEVQLVFGKIQKYGLDSRIWPQERLPTNPSFRRLLKGNFIPTSTVMLRRAMLDRVGLFDEKYTVCEDYQLWLRVALVSRLYALPDVLCLYRVHTHGISLHQEAMFNALDQLYTYFEHEKGISPRWLAPGRRSVYLKRMSLAQTLPERIQAIWYYLKSFFDC